MKRLLNTIFLLTICTVAFSQSPHFTANADTNRILIGEQIVVTLKASLPKNSKFTWPVYTDTIKGLELVESGKLDTITSGDEWELTQNLTITSFDSGYVAFPPLLLNIGNQKVTSPAIAIEVGMPTLKPEQELYDIKAPLEPPIDWIPILLWTLGIIALIVGIVLLVNWLQKRKRTVKLTPEQKLTPYEFALWQIREIEKEQLWQAGKTKEYYSRITDVLRLYMERQMGINAMESTADEIIQKIQILALPSELHQSSIELFHLSAMVKFAKKKPGTEEHERSMTVVKAFLNHTKPVEEKNESETKQPEIR